MVRKTKIAYALMIVISGLLLTSCQYSLAMWVVEDSTANNLLFGFSDTRNSEEKVQPVEIRVFPCASIKRQPQGSYYPSEEYAVWSAYAPYDAFPPPTNRITYGQAQGLQNRRNAQPLAILGCYVVTAYARDKYDITSMATVGFNINADGKVIEMSESEYEKVFDD